MSVCYLALQVKSVFQFLIQNSLLSLLPFPYILIHLICETSPFMAGGDSWHNMFCFHTAKRQWFPLISNWGQDITERYKHENNIHVYNNHTSLKKII